MHPPPGHAYPGRVSRPALLLLLLFLGGQAALLALVPTSAETPPEPATRLPELAVEARAADPVDPRSPVLPGTEDLRPGRARVTLADALRGVPGVLAQEHFGGFEPARISIRGSGLQSAPLSRGLNFLLDGLPLNSADGSFNGAVVDPLLADQVNVTRGPAGFGDATGVLGGAIELRSALRGQPALATSVRAGSFGLLGATASAHSRQGNITLAAAVDAGRQDGDRDHAAQSRTGVLLSASRPMPTGAESRVSVYHVRSAYDVPGPLTLAAAAPRSVNSDVARDLPRRVAEATHLSLQTKQENADLSVRLGASWLHGSDWFRQLAANGISDSSSDDLALRAGFVRQLDTATAAHRLQLHAGYTQGWRDVRRYANQRAATGPLFGDDRLRATTYSLEAGDEVDLSPTVTARLGVAGLVARRAIVDRMPDSPAPRTTLSPSASAFQPRAALFWTPRHDLHLHAGLSRAAEPPTFDDLLVVTGIAPALKRRSQRLAMQTATTGEVGAAGRRGPLEWDVTAYTARWEGEILRLADVRGLPRGAVNADTTRHEGVDAWLRWTLVDGPASLRCVALGSWSRFTFVDDPVFGRNRLAGFPSHQGMAELQYESDAGPLATVGGDWTAGSTSVDHAGRMSYGAHAIATLRAGWRSRQGWRAFIEVRNLFDRAYLASTAGVLDVARNPAATSVFLPGTGRSVVVRVEWRLP